MHVRRLSMLLCALGVSAIGSAQTTILDDDRGLAYDQFQEAFNAFAVYRSAKFTIKVTESADFWKKRYGYVEGHLLIDTLSATPTVLFECNEFAGAEAQPKALLRRIVGDGSTFYVYDAATMTYTAKPYGGPKLKQDLMRLIADATASSPSTLIGKLLRQVHGGPYPQFMPNDWLPYASLQPARKYDSMAFLKVGDPSVGERSVGIDISPLNKIIYVDRAPGNVISAPSISWEMTIYPGTGNVAGTVSYRFVPPPNSRKVETKSKTG